MTKVATEKLISGIVPWSFCTVADHIGSSPSHHARDSEVPVISPSRAETCIWLVFLTRNPSHDNVSASSRHLPPFFQALTMSKVRLPQSLKIKFGLGAKGLVAIPSFFNAFMILARQPRDILIGL